MICEKRCTMLSNVLLVLGALLIVISVFYTLWLRSSIKSLEYKLGNMQQKQYELLKKQRNLMAKKENLLSLNSVDSLAIKKMGFEFPDRNRVIYVKERL
ncbi:MAG: cell division protein FtsL [Nitrospirae bacterium]|nr:cell division protein FtsL [Nitrospirota bacterium]